MICCQLKSRETIIKVDGVEYWIALLSLRQNKFDTMNLLKIISSQADLMFHSERSLSVQLRVKG